VDGARSGLAPPCSVGDEDHREPLASLTDGDPGVGVAGDSV
jgi:hypothetical protein